jgi:two-component system chemotaxis sensor kinase CheA
MQNNRHSEIFKEEAYELLAELESALLALEETPDDPELIGRVFRAMHTIKGSGAMFGFDDIAAFTHEVETIYDLVRSGEIAITKELVDLTLSARDHILAMLNATEGAGATGEAKTKELVRLFKSLHQEAGAKETPHSAPASSLPEKQSSDTSGDNVTYRIRFRPVGDIFRKGTNPVFLLDELRQLGDCEVIAQTDLIPVLKDMDPESCYTYWDVLLTTSRGTDAIKDVFIFVEDECELHIEVIDGSGSLDNEAAYKKLGDILVERGDLTQDDLEKVLREQKRIGEMLVEAGVVDARHVESALSEQRQVRGNREKRIAAESASSIRVQSHKLDTLVDLVGELVTVQARLSQTAAMRNDGELLSISEVVERLTEELRDNTMSIRMMPMGTTFGKFRRLVRDLSRELGKEVEMITEGAETELDKTVIERLSDPMVHLIRNCIDHGIETPDVREGAGKPRQGRVYLSAVHSGAHVLIRVRDDGCGLDAENIHAKAVEKGMISPEAELSEKDIYALILAPGFSTAKDITNVSGRGVGMDVVKRSIDALRGSIEIDSEKGAGTTVTLKLPLTLAIIEGLLVKLGVDNFVLPLSAVEECIELTREDVARAHGRHIINVREQIVPYIHLRNHFHMKGDVPALQQIVITGTNGQRVGFVVDHIVGEHQTVIKNLGKMYRDTKGISGATILGDGTVALILDIHQLIESVEVEETSCIGH